MADIASDETSIAFFVSEKYHRIRDFLAFILLSMHRLHRLRKKITLTKTNLFLFIEFFIFWI